MSELLLVAENSAIIAVMRASDKYFAYADDISDEERQRRVNAANILTFAPRHVLRRWGLHDPRFRGIAGNDEDLHAILHRHMNRADNFLVPFSNGPIVAEGELPHHGATWEKFHDLFADEDWTFKFGRRSDWLNIRVTDPDFIGAERYAEIG